MKSLFKQALRVTLAAVATVALLGVVAPFINASAFSGRIHGALQTTLGRQVDFDEVHFTLFSGPGFTLSNVTIHEDRRFGLEPFAFVPELKVRLRLDRLLLGHIAVANLRLEDPSLNLVKLESGEWNLVQLVQRVSAPSKLPVNLFPAFGISNARIDFKLGTRKTVLYVTDADLSIYPERSGKLYVQFSGSPARTDRAGNGFSHLRGSANWYLQPTSASANQLEADITLDRSNLSELTTLFQGQDAGVHGDVSSHASIEGPLDALRVTGELRLRDLHRWDLVEGNGEDWRIPYSGMVDATKAHTVKLSTPAASTLAVELHSGNFLKDEWQFAAALNKASLPDLLPLATHMGIHLPEKAKVSGTVDGSLVYASRSGVSGKLTVSDVAATQGDTAPLRAQTVTLAIGNGHVRVEPIALQTDGDGTIAVNGDYDTAQQLLTMNAEITRFPIESLRANLGGWLQNASALDHFAKGTLTGHLTYTSAPTAPWSGDVHFTGADIDIDGIPVPLIDGQGHAVFHASSLAIDHFSAKLRSVSFSGTYQYNAGQHHPEHVALVVPAADVNDIEWALRPAVGDDSLLARIGVSKRSVPDWLSHRDLQGDVTINELSVAGTPLGAVRSKLVWQGSNVQLSALHVAMANGEVSATGTVALGTGVPRYELATQLTHYKWHSGELSATAQLQTSGLGPAVLSNLKGEGEFKGDDVNVAAGDAFSSLTGKFSLSFADGWPNLRLTELQASQDEEQIWTGQGSTDRDGKLVFDLEHDGRQRKVISTLQSQAPTAANTGAISTLR